MSEICAEELKARASERTNLADFGDDVYEEGLTVLCRSLNHDAALNAFGQASATDYLLNVLETRLKYIELWRQRPGLFDTALTPPLIIIGLPRSGTTYLHRLLCEDPASRHIPAWESRHPIHLASEDTRRSEMVSRFDVATSLSPELQRQHVFNIDAPEECGPLFDLTFLSPAILLMFPVFSYHRWYLEQCKHDAVVTYRNLLQIVQATSPTRRLVLKNTQHYLYLDELSRVLPNAQYVFLTRDPVQAVPSTISTLETAYARVSEIGHRELTYRVCEFLYDMARRGHENRSGIPESNRLEIEYDDLIRSPLGVVEGVYRHFELDWSPGVEAAIVRHIQDDLAPSRGQHRYSLSDYGLNERTIKRWFVDHDGWDSTYSTWLERAGTFDPIVLTSLQSAGTTDCPDGRTEDVTLVSEIDFFRLEDQFPGYGRDVIGTGLVTACIATIEDRGCVDVGLCTADDSATDQPAIGPLRLRVEGQHSIRDVLANTDRELAITRTLAAPTFGDPPGISYPVVISLTRAERLAPDCLADIHIDSEGKSIVLRSAAAASDTERVRYLADAFADLYRQFVRAPDTPIRELAVSSERRYPRLVVDRIKRTSDVRAPTSVGNPDGHHGPEPAGECPVVCGDGRSSHEEPGAHPEVWIAGDRARTDAECVHQLIERQAANTPDGIALIHGSAQVTYAELNASANRLGRYLRRRGVGSDQPVGICMDRSPEMIIALLGVLKAGGGYLPLDCTYPESRLAYMLNHARVRHVLTQERRKSILPPFAGSALCLDTEWEAISRESARNVHSAAASDNLCYVVYTSGSTGKPKCVAMDHRPLVNLMIWQSTQFEPAEGTRTLQFAPLSFDVSFQEIVSTLMTGGTLVLIDEEMRVDPCRLLRFIREQSVERLFLPFIALQQLAEAMSTEDRVPCSLKDVITAGEQLQITRQIQAMFENMGECILHNHYGPSETHVVTAYRLQGAPDSWPRLPPIGTPILNATIRILDPQQRPVPRGEPGELYVGGIPLARGYLHQDEPTAERFLADPFSDTPRARMYRTGDFARLREDGNIEFLGRLDGQVKVRGYRVELGEIEVALASCPDILHAAVAVRDEEPDERRLVAYYVVEAGAETGAATLRQCVRQQLPDHMIPSAFVRIEEMPRTPSGKIDRRSLLKRPVPNHQRPGTSVEYAAPSTEMERSISSMWQDVLGIVPVGLNDNFFELGGHSLNVVRVFSRIEQDCGMRLPIALLFEYPTLAAFARAVDRMRGQGKSDATRVVTSREVEVGGTEPTNRPDRGHSPEARPWTIPLNPIDNLFHAANAVMPGYSLIIHEYATPQTIDEERFRDATLYALNLHPIARATIAPRRWYSRRVFWSIPHKAESVPVRTLECRDDAHLEQTRHQLRTTYASWKGDFVFQFVICRHPGGTHLFLCTNHAATDRIGLNRFMTSVLAHYLDRPDEPKRTAPFSHDELVSAWDTRFDGRLPDGFRAAQSRLADRVARDAQSNRKGLGHATLKVSEAETDALIAVSRQHGTSVNRLLELALIDAVKKWNEEHGKRVRCVRLRSTMNMRPASLYHEVVGNVVFNPVTVYDGTEEYDAWIRRQMSPNSKAIEAGLLLFQFSEYRSRTNRLPLALKRSLEFLKLGWRLAPTLLVTNMQFAESDALGGLLEALELVEMDTSQFDSFRYFPPYVLIVQRGSTYQIRINHSLSHLDPGASQRFVECLQRSIRSFGTWPLPPTRRPAGRHRRNGGAGRP